MRKSGLLVALFAAVIAGCGGGSGDDAFQPGVTPGAGGSTTVATVATTSSATSIPTDGSATAQISALVKDANNNALSGVPVTFSSSAGSLVVVQSATNGSGTTDATGIAKATLSAAGAASGTAITVTATAGSISSNVVVNVLNTQQTVTVVTNMPQIPSDSSKGATITALVRGANNQFLPGVTVSFQATSGGLVITQATTNANGAATATLDAAGDPTNRRITVTATAGSATGTVPVDVTGTKLTLTGSPSLVQGSTGTYTVSLTDSSNAGIPNKAVTIASSANNGLNAATGTTDSTGHVAFVMTATNSGNDTLTARALGLQAQQAVAVSGQSFVINPPAPLPNNGIPQINLGVSQQVTVTWTSSGVPQANKTINFSTTRGSVSAPTAVTGSDGKATITVSSAVPPPGVESSGPAVITASSTGVTAQVTVNFVATVPSSIAIQATPSTIPTQGQSTITAIVRDAQNNLVEGKAVDFQTVGDITGGTLTVASALTDSQGRAQTTYVASSTPSSSNGVVVKATVQSTAINASVNLTVGGQAVFLSLGTGNKISENASKTQFIVPYTVQALDSAGNAVNGVPITLTIHSVPPSANAYGKGGWIYPSGATSWIQTGTPVAGTLTPITVCPNEDANLNGVLDSALLEDAGANGNHNGILDPGDVAAVSPGVVTTANGGSAELSVIYPQDHALWVQVRLTATATVQGTETSASTVFSLPMLAEYLTNQTVNPPGFRSPYGVATLCTNPN